MDNSSNNKRIAKNTLFLYIRMIFVLLVSLYTTRAVLNALGVEDFGIYNVIAGFVTMFGFLNTSFSGGIQRFYNYSLAKEGNEGLTRVYNSAIVIQIVVASVSFLFLETVGLWYVNTKMVISPGRLDVTLWLFHFSIASLLLLMLETPYTAAVMAHEKMNYYAIVSMIDAVARLVIAIVLPLVFYDKLFIYGLMTLCISIANFLLYYIYAKINFKELRLKLAFDKGLLKSMLSFSGWNIFGTFAFMLKAQGVTVLLNAFFGTVVNAAQGIANQIQNAIYGFSGNVVTAFRPQLVQSYAAGNYDRVRSMFFSLSKISYVLLYMLSVPVSLEINYILHLWLGSEVPEYTTSFTILVLANMVISCLHTPLTQIIHASGKMKKFQIITSVIMCMIIPISWAFLRLGANPNSVYWVSLFVLLCNQAACLFVVREVLPYSIYQYIKKVVFPCLILTIALPLICSIPRFIMNESFLRLLLTCFVSALSTIVMLYFILADRSEKEIINKMVLSKIRNLSFASKY